MAHAQTAQRHHDRIARAVLADLTDELHHGAATPGRDRHIDGEATGALLAVGGIGVRRQTDDDDHLLLLAVLRRSCGEFLADHLQLAEPGRLEIGAHGVDSRPRPRSRAGRVDMVPGRPSGRRRL